MADTDTHRLQLLGIDVSVVSAEQRDLLVRRVTELEAVAKQVPELLSRLDVSERRFSQVRRTLSRASEAIAEATKNARTELDLDDVQEEAPSKSTAKST